MFGLTSDIVGLVTWRKAWPNVDQHGRTIEGMLYFKKMDLPTVNRLHVFR